MYFKERCFALNAETLIDRAFSDLKYIGGTYGALNNPTNFLCLLLKMLQIQPEEDIVLEFINQDDHKYIRALGCFYYRLTEQKASKIYKILEPLYSNYKRMIIREQNEYKVIHMDEFID